MKTLPLRALLACFLGSILSTAAIADPLPAWREGPTKAALIRFVEQTTREGSPDFVPLADRIAVFDNDGTLWCEQPIYFQGYYAFERVRELAPQHPEWATTEPFASVLKGDYAAVLKSGEQGIFNLLATTHAGLTIEEFTASVRTWIATARHPTTGRLLTEMAYQPMLEALAYLRAHGYRTYIVSGGGIEFIRAWAETVYGIPPEQVIGSIGGLQFELREGKGVLLKTPKVEFVNDHDGKAVGIQRHIGRRPIIAFGNADGDLEMLQLTTTGSGARLGLVIHHTDAEREWAYDRTSSIGRLNKVLDEAALRGWTVVSMKDDWQTIFAP
jgi:hypothetical protein